MFEIVAKAAEATNSTSGAGTEAGQGSLLSLLLMFVLPLAIFYFILIAPQRKKEKSIQKMRNELVVGDEIVTIGGIVGKIIKIKDDEVTVENGADKNRLILKKWAVNEVIKKVEAPKPLDDDDNDAYLDELIEEEKKQKKKNK